MQENYRLIGIMDMFGIVPNFVFPVFEKDKKYYFMTGDEATLKVEDFLLIKESAVERIIFINNLKTNELLQKDMELFFQIIEMPNWNL